MLIILWYDDYFADFHVRLVRSRIICIAGCDPKCNFGVDEEKPFAPFPRDTALPFLEWGINWCVATHAHHYLMLHAGVVEKE